MRSGVSIKNYVALGGSIEFERRGAEHIDVVGTLP
jgi:hypothetical protein